MNDPLAELRARFASETQIRCRTGTEAKELTTFAIGGPLSLLIEPTDDEQLKLAVRFMRDSAVDYKILGAGSNLLISDAGLTTAVLRLGRGFRYSREFGRESEHVLLEVGGAMSLMSLARECGEAGYAGLEFAGGIPASLGGAVRMNAGAHGGEMKDVIHSVTLLMPDGELSTRTREQIRFSYRHTDFPAEAVVVRAVLRMRIAGKEEINQRRAEYLEERKKRQPLSLPSAGSVFRNPNEKSAGYWIEQAGLKGAAHGGAKISEKHANWIVNEERAATCADVSALISICREAVEARFGVRLEPEIIVWR